jgi:hypothetical protein
LLLQNELGVGCLCVKAAYTAAAAAAAAAAQQQQQQQQQQQLKCRATELKLAVVVELVVGSALQYLPVSCFCRMSLWLGACAAYAAA